MLRFLSFLSALCLWSPPFFLPGQGTDRAVLSGTVSDSTGAMVQGATAHLRPAGRPQAAELEQRTDAHGDFSFSVPAGSYALSVEAEGFARYTKPALKLQPHGSTRLAIRLTVGGIHEELNVLDSDSADPTDPNSAAGGLVLEGKGLDFLSTNPATLRQQLDALAGGGATFLVDGFSGGRLPPKSSIRSIRINRNAFSAYFADLGFARVEIDTKPGTDHLHGSLDFSGTNRPFDAPNPYAGLQPPFYDFQQDANLTGPLGKNTSFLFSDAIEDLANSSVVNATDPTALTANISTATPAPQRTDTFAVRIDRQFGPKQYGYIRDEWSRTHIANSGIVPLVLPEAAFTSDVLTNTLQLVHTDMLGPHAVNEAAFQYLRTRLRQEPNSTLPSVVVQGAFQSGGNPSQFLHDNQDAYEVRDRFEFDRGPHAVRTGFRFRALRDANSSSAGFNGQYIFRDLASFQAGQASQYSQTFGQPGATLLTSDLALYAEDDWKLTRNLTLSYGLRFESQTAIPDHFDPAPRVVLAWAVRPGQRKQPIITLRAGYGIFYDRFPALQLLQSVRQNGVREVAYFAKDTPFNPTGPPPGVVLDATQPTIFQVDPHLRSSYAQAGSLTAVRSLGRFGAFSAIVLYIHNTHNFLTRNVNAPLPGTYDPNDPASGVRPLGSQANVYQFSSAANGNRENFTLRYQLQLTARISGYGQYRADKFYEESDSVDQFPSNPYNLRLDYGRAALDRAHAFTGGFRITLPYGFTLNPFLSATTGAPFDVTLGTDQNGDTIYNDRPTFASNVTGASVVQTAIGAFNVAPTSGEAVIPRNYGTAPGYFWLYLRAGKDFQIGPKPAQAAGAAEAGTPPATRPWTLNFSVEAQNLSNHNNPGLPVGVLSAQPCNAGATGTCTCTAAQGACPLQPSRFFDRSLTLANGISPITAANRIFFLQTSFTW